MSNSMKIALPITLMLGGVSLVFCVLISFFYYADSIGESQSYASTYRPQTLESTIATSNNIDGLKLACSQLAKDADHNQLLVRAVIDKGNYLIRHLLAYAFVWCLATGLALVYVHVLLRRLANAR